MEQQPSDPPAESSDANFSMGEDEHKQSQDLGTIDSLDSLKPLLTYISNFCNTVLNLKDEENHTLDVILQRIYTKQ